MVLTHPTKPGKTLIFGTVQDGNLRKGDELNIGREDKFYISFRENSD